MYFFYVFKYKILLILYMCCIKIILVLLNENNNILSINQSDAFLNMTRCDIKPNIKIKSIYFFYFLFSVKMGMGFACAEVITTMPECFLWLPGCLYAVAKVFLACSYAVASWFPQINQPFKTYLIFKTHICGIRFSTNEI